MHGVPEHPQSQPVQPLADDDRSLPAPGLVIPKPDLDPPMAIPPRREPAPPPEPASKA